MATREGSKQRSGDLVLGFLRSLSSLESVSNLEEINALCFAYYLIYIFEARTIRDIDYDSTNIEIEAMDKHCLLLRRTLTMEEQMALFADIERKDKTPEPAMKPMYPSPKTLVFDEENVVLRFNAENNSLYNQLIHKANDIIARNQEHHELNDVDLTQYRSITMGAIKYPSPNGHFPAHIDHDDSFVYLLSIGCTANDKSKLNRESENASNPR